MIYTPFETGWIAITQPAHAWMAGGLAAAWGNAQFVQPAPYDAVVLATRLHDIGWTALDAAPRLNADGQPAGFLAATLAETTPIWQQAVQQVGQLDPYSAILVSQHATTIYERRRERGIDPPEEQARIAALLQEQSQWRIAHAAQLRSRSTYAEATTAEAFRAAYRWLRVCDLLSLHALTDVFSVEGEIDEVPGQRVGDYVVLRYRQSAPFILQLDPYPFSSPTVSLRVVGRELPHKTYATQEQFEEGFARAAWRQLTVIVQPLEA